MTMPIQEVLRLDRYKSTETTGTGRMDMTETITLDSFPLCSWNVDAFNAWVAQNAVPITINAIPSAVQTATGMITGQSSNSALGSVQNILTSAYTASITANDVKGNYATNNALLVKDKCALKLNENLSLLSMLRLLISILMYLDMLVTQLKYPMYQVDHIGIIQNR